MTDRSDRPIDATDVNDLARLQEAEPINDAQHCTDGPADTARPADGDWAAPQSLMQHVESEPWPIDALPPMIGAAAEGSAPSTPTRLTL